MRKTKLKNIATNISVLIIATILFLVFLEGILRVATPSPQDALHNFVRTNDSRNYENAPDYTYASNGVTYKTNNDGLRSDVNYSKDKGNKTRIVVLSDSVAWGLGVNNSDTSAQVLQRSLSKSTGRGVEVLNFGVLGYDTSAKVYSLKAKALAYHPDIVILKFVMNDIEPSEIVFNDENSPTECVLPIINLKVSCKTKDLIRNLRVVQFAYNGIKNAFYTNVDDYYSLSWSNDDLYNKNVLAPIKEFKSICTKNNLTCEVMIVPLFKFNSTYYPWEAQENKLISDIKKLNLPFLALRTGLQKYPAEELADTKNDILHPNVLGNKIIAEEEQDFISKIYDFNAKH